MATQVKQLTEAQADHLAMLIEKLNEAQGKANKFLSQYAAAHGVPLGAEGWVFHQDEMRFVQMPQKVNDGQEGS